MLARTLPRLEWTHESHLATTTYLLTRRPDIDIDKQLPDFIRRYNESVGGVNSDSEGYHETITRVFLRGVRLFLAEADFEEPLHELVNELLLSPMGRRDWRLRFYSGEHCSRSSRGASSCPPTSPRCPEERRGCIPPSNCG